MVTLSYLKQEAVDTLRDGIEVNLEVYRSGNFEHLIVKKLMLIYALLQDQQHEYSP